MIYVYQLFVKYEMRILVAILELQVDLHKWLHSPRAFGALAADLLFEP